MKIRTRFATTLLLGTICFGCRQPAPPPKTYFVDAAPVNALVPKTMDRLLEFESRDVVSGVNTKVAYTLPIPKGWPGDFLSFHPTDKLNNGDSWMLVAPSCDQLYCDPEDPNDAMDEVMARAPGRNDSWEVLRDERRTHQRVIVLKNYHRNYYGTSEEAGTSIQVVTWKNGGLRPHQCAAHLAVEIQEAAPAFQKACELMVVHE